MIETKIEVVDKKPNFLSVGAGFAITVLPTMVDGVFKATAGETATMAWGLQSIWDEQVVKKENELLEFFTEEGQGKTAEDRPFATFFSNAVRVIGRGAQCLAVAATHLLFKLPLQVLWNATFGAWATAASAAKELGLSGALKHMWWRHMLPKETKTYFKKEKNNQELYDRRIEEGQAFFKTYSSSAMGYKDDEGTTHTIRDEKGNAYFMPVVYNKMHALAIALGIAVVTGVLVAVFAPAAPVALFALLGKGAAGLLASFGLPALSAAATWVTGAVATGIGFVAGLSAVLQTVVIASITAAATAAAIGVASGAWALVTGGLNLLGMGVEKLSTIGKGSEDGNESLELDENSSGSDDVNEKTVTCQLNKNKLFIVDNGQLGGQVQNATSSSIVTQAIAEEQEALGTSEAFVRITFLFTGSGESLTIQPQEFLMLKESGNPQSGWMELAPRIHNAVLQKEVNDTNVNVDKIDDTVKNEIT